MKLFWKIIEKLLLKSGLSGIGTNENYLLTCLI